MSVLEDLGPTTPSRAAIYAQAVELQALSRLAVEFTVPGPHADVPRALRQIARMREVLGEDPGDGDPR